MQKHSQPNAFITFSTPGKPRVSVFSGQTIEPGFSGKRTTDAKRSPKRRTQQLNRRRVVKFAAASLAIGQVSVLGADARFSNSSGQPGQRLGKVSGRRDTGPSIHKQRAMQDHQHNMAAFGGRLAAPVERLLQPVPRKAPYQFDVLVVGSGYGASITAARLASSFRPGCRLGVLERGKEWVPGTFPDNLPGVMEESRLKLLGAGEGNLNNPTGLYNVQKFDEITILSGSGLGGSSLINANVAIRPDREVFLQSVWPRALRNREYLDPYYALAEYELGIASENWDSTNKMRAQRLAAERLSACGAHFEPAKLTIARSPRRDLPVLNRQGLRQRGCIDCGDCLTGCNVGAKSSLAQNYLPIARRAGAEIFPQVTVNHIEKCQDFYRVHYTFYSAQKGKKPQAKHGFTTTRILVLGAGSLGSSEILMRSQAHKFAFSPRLGLSWTGNGDALGFIRNCQVPTGVGGFSAYDSDRAPVGPTIQSNITYPHRSLAGRVLIQDGAAARAYCNAIGLLMRDLDLDRLQILLGMGHDGAEGRLSLDGEGKIQLNWPGLLESDYRRLIRGEFSRVGEALGGKYEYLKIFGDKMISVHPLGGCGMGEDLQRGVTNHKGQVYDGYLGGYETLPGVPAVHEGLYVVDGALLPTSIGCNPLLTISALAERCSSHLISEPSFADLFWPQIQ
ncbi:MAG: GMC family oxidoreductase N-terminal domain-containing protein [Planctomycetota bacterium]